MPNVSNPTIEKRIQLVKKAHDSKNPRFFEQEARINIMPIIEAYEKSQNKYKAMFDVSAAQEAELETANKRIKHLENELESANKDAGF